MSIINVNLKIFICKNIVLVPKYVLPCSIYKIELYYCKPTSFIVLIFKFFFSFYVC